MTERDRSHVILRRCFQITQTETDNQTGHNNMTLSILFYSNRCSILPPQRNRQVRRITTPYTVKCSISPSMAALICRMAFFSSTSVVWELRYARDFKHSRNQKSTGVKSGDLEDRWISKPRLITWSSVKDSYMNVLTSRARWGGAPSCMKVTIVTKKRKILSCSDWVGFPAAYRKRFFIKERA